MNSSASGKTFIKMQNQLLKDDDCACFLVEAIAKNRRTLNGKLLLMVKEWDIGLFAG